MKKEYYDYIVYSDGRVYSKKKNRFLKDNIDSWGYVYNKLVINNERKHIRRNRLIAELFINNPNPEKFDQVNHKDGNKLNNSKDNLEWCNCYLNNKHARDTGLNNISESNSRRMKNNPDLKNKILKNLEKNWYTDKTGYKNPNFKKDILYKDKLYSSQEFADKFNLSIKTVYIQRQKYNKNKPVKLWKDNNITIINLE